MMNDVGELKKRIEREIEKMAELRKFLVMRRFKTGRFVTFRSSSTKFEIVKYYCKIHCQVILMICLINPC